MIGLSPLIATHPSILQHTRVRPSKRQSNSACSQLDHLISGLMSATKSPLLLAFATPSHNCLSSPHLLTHWPIIQKVRCKIINYSNRSFSYKFQNLFHSLLGFFFIFPSLVLVHYRSTDYILAFNKWTCYIISITDLIIQRFTQSKILFINDKPTKTKARRTGLKPSRAVYSKPLSRNAS